MIPDRYIWAAALAIVKRYGDDAMLEASERADQLLDEGDMAGAETCHRILNAIETLEAPRHQEQIAGMEDERMGNDRAARDDLEAAPSIERRGTLILVAPRGTPSRRASP